MIFAPCGDDPYLIIIGYTYNSTHGILVFSPTRDEEFTIVTSNGKNIICGYRTYDKQIYAQNDVSAAWNPRFDIFVTYI